ncbi:hypothetical protein D3C81_809950 [compost metagenome]
MKPNISPATLAHSVGKLFHPMLFKCCAVIERLPSLWLGWGKSQGEEKKMLKASNEDFCRRYWIPQILLKNSLMPFLMVNAYRLV